MDKVGVGIIGAGGIASAHAKAYSLLKSKVALVGVADIDEERAQNFASRFHIPIWTAEPDDLLARDDIQIISMCTPHYLHAPLTIQALKAGKHVLVEKPIATSLEEADQMIRTAEKANRNLGVVFQLRFEADVARAKQVLDASAIGQPFYTEVSCLWWRRPVYYEVSWRGKWATEGGGALINQASHHVDLLLHLMSMPSEVTATIDTVAHEIEVEDWCLATMKWENGMHGSFCASTAAELENDFSRMMVLGSYGTIQMFPFRPYSREETRLLQIAEICRQVPDQELSGHTQLIHDFVHSVLERRPPRVSGTEGRQALELITAIYQSAFTGEPVSLPLPPNSPCYTTAGKLEMARHYVAKRGLRT